MATAPSPAPRPRSTVERVLEDYQARLDAATARGTAERTIDRKLTGAAELEPFVRSFVRADGSSVTLLTLDRHVRNAEGEAVGLRTVYAPVDLTA